LGVCASAPKGAPIATTANAKPRLAFTELRIRHVPSICNCDFNADLAVYTDAADLEHLAAIIGRQHKPPGSVAVD
jgi:hypothetical protein